MLFSYLRLTPDELDQIELVSEIELRQHGVISRLTPRWRDLYARLTRASALRASLALSGSAVSAEDALAAVDGETPADGDATARRRAHGLQMAFAYVLQRGGDPGRGHTTDVIRAAHFMVAEGEPNAGPGRLRRSWGGVRDPAGTITYEGADPERLESLVSTLASALTEPRVPALVRGALAHLNIALLRPFAGANGRLARCVHALVIAGSSQDGAAWPGIDEFLLSEQTQYLAALDEAGGRRWSPQRSPRAFVRLCLRAHEVRAETLLRRAGEIERLAADLADLASRRNLPERTDLALGLAALGLRVSNPNYRAAARISNNLASRDLKALVDSGLLLGEGDKRGREYLPSPVVTAIRDRHRKARASSPGAGSARRGGRSRQPSLFDDPPGSGET